MSLKEMFAKELTFPMHRKTIISHPYPKQWEIGDMTFADIFTHLIESPGSGPFPGILDMWGGGREFLEYRTALLASHGYVCLALEYMTPEILSDPSRNIGDQYFEMEKMMEEAGNSHLLTILSYPGAGHLIKPPYTPHVRSSVFTIGLTGRKVVALWGGEVSAHSHAQEDSWHRTLAFLQQHLYGYDPKTLGTQ